MGTVYIPSVLEGATGQVPTVQADGQVAMADPASVEPLPHHTTHENGGSDEISVAGLSGVLADAQTPSAHKTSHENGGADEISVAGLSGLLADAQTPLTHTMASHSDEGALATLSTVGTTQIDDAAVTLAKMADIASPSFIARGSGIGTGVPQALTPLQATAILATMVGDTGAGGAKGLVPVQAAGDAAAGKYLKADGVWTVPPGGAGTPATTVTSEESFGIADAVGISTNYAREDHTHGSPAAPTAASVGADATGTAAAAVATHVGLADPHTQYALESALGTMSAINDAASDGSTYGRLNGAWSAVSSGGLSQAQVLTLASYRY